MNDLTPIARIARVQKNPKWWRYLVRFLLVVTIGVVFINLFSFWAINAKYFGGQHLGVFIGSVFVTAYSLYASLGLLVISVTGVIIGLFLEYSVRDITMAFVISMLPLISFLFFVR